MKGSKILAVLVVLAMLLSTMVILNEIGINVVPNAGAAATVIGVDVFQGAKTGDTILNMTASELENLKYNQAVTLKFNGTLISSNSWVYKPLYKSAYKSGIYEVWTNWTRLEGQLAHNILTPTLTNVQLDASGLWLVVNYSAGSPGEELLIVNMSDMTYKDEILNKWYNITGWFWVNSSSWTVTLTKDTVYYDNNESLTISVSDATTSGFIDIWNIAGSTYSLVYHKAITVTSGMTLTIYGEEMYEYTHSKGAGIYSVTAYSDVNPAFTTAKYIYDKGQAVGDNTNDGEYGYNSTFGSETIWSERFIATGTTTVIRDWEGNRIGTGDWSGTTYKYSECGPFDPPEYWSGYENFTVAAGVPTATITNGSQFWNDSADNEVYINVTDYDGHSLDFTGKTVLLYNKSQDPSKSTSIPIDSDYTTITRGPGWIKISPNGTGNGWGYNTTLSTTWAPKGKVYVVYAMNTTGNASEEWNGTSFFTLISAAARFVWVDDDGGLTVDTTHTDGVLPIIPDITKVPLDIQFKIQGDDYSYWGDTSAGETITEAAENITISGNSLFTGTLDQFPGFAVGDFSTDTWTVSIIPTMSQSGGKITITAVAWNKTITADLTIGGGNYWKNGSVVAVTPNEFNILAQDQPLSITVSTAKGANNQFATVDLFYLDDDGAPAGTSVRQITADSNGLYSLMFNKTQQWDNQTGSIKAPRNLIIYVDGTTNAGYGYALVKMKPENDLKVNISKSTILAGYNYDDFYINTTVINKATGNSTGTPESDDEGSFFVVVYDEDNNNVTDDILSGGDYDYTDLIGSYSFDLTDLYITEPGTYTFYAYNDTHNSEGYNATLVVNQVSVVCDKDPLIWRYDDNISATFTVTYGGVESVSAGTLVIDNMTLSDDYNKTWVNSSFDGGTLYLGSVGGNNDSLVLDEDLGFVDGVVTVNDITANYLASGEAEQYITFWFKPDNGAYARAIGVLPVSVPSVATDKTKVALDQRTTVVATVTGRGTPLEDVFVGLHGCGITVAETNGTTGSDGTVIFSILPTVTGTIRLDVGEAGRVTDATITVNNWALDIAVEVQVDEALPFTVTITKTGTTTPVEGAYVVFTGETGTQVTGATGIVTFDAPNVKSDRPYTISVTAEGYTPASTTITVINVPKLFITVSGTKEKEVYISPVTVTVYNDDGALVTGAAITFGTETATTVNGQATFTVTHTDAKSYDITASFAGFEPADTVTIQVKAKGGIPGFELVTLIAAIGVALILLRRRRN